MNSIKRRFGAIRRRLGRMSNRFKFKKPVAPVGRWEKEMMATLPEIRKETQKVYNRAVEYSTARGVKDPHSYARKQVNDMILR